MDKLQRIEKDGQAVLTTEQLAQVYGCDAKRISENFKRNADHFEEGQHYFKLEGDELREFKMTNPQIAEQSLRAPVMYLWTRRGSSRHCKMLGTDKAWEMFDQLEETYFNPPQRQLSQLEILAGATQALLDQQREIDRIKMANEKQEKEMKVLNSRVDTMNGVCITGDKQQKLNQMILLYAARNGLQYSEGWHKFRQSYNTGYHTNITAACNRFAEKQNIKKLSIPAYLMKSGYIDDGLMVADKMLNGVTV